MPNFKLECEHRFPWDETLDIRNTTEFNYDDLDSVLQGMTDFLRGCGFVFQGELRIVNDHEESGCCGGCDNTGENVMNWTVDQLSKTIKKEDVEDANQG